MTERSKVIGKLDVSFSKAVRERDGRCMRCGRMYNLQCAHVFSRSKMSVRWDMNNAITLCGGCHIYWAHKFPLDFYDWIRHQMGEHAFIDLRRKSDFPVKFTVGDLKLLLKQ